MKNSKLLLWGSLHSLAVSAYVFLVALFMRNVENIFGNTEDNIFSPLVFILLFMFSALVTGGLVLAKPIMLYIDGQKKDGVKLLFYTGLGLFACLLIFFLLMIVV